MKILKVSLPKRALALVLEWANAHREELFLDWQLAEMESPLIDIEPLM